MIRGESNDNRLTGRRQAADSTLLYGGVFLSIFLLPWLNAEKKCSIIYIGHRRVTKMVAGEFDTSSSFHKFKKTVRDVVVSRYKCPTRHTVAVTGARRWDSGICTSIILSILTLIIVQIDISLIFWPRYYYKIDIKIYITFAIQTFITIWTEGSKIITINMDIRELTTGFTGSLPKTIIDCNQFLYIISKQ